MARSAPFALLVGLALTLLHASIAYAQVTLPDDVEAPASSIPATATDAGVELLWPAVMPHGALAEPVLRRGRDMGLISTGIALLSAGMIVGIGIASNDLAHGNCHDFTSLGRFEPNVQCGSAPFALVPLAGSILVPSVTFHGFVDSGLLVPGLIGAAPQIAGLILLLVGLHGYTEDLGSLRIEPIVSSSEVGFSMRLSL